MKKRLKQASIAILFFILAGIGFITYQFNVPLNESLTHGVSDRNLVYFAESYEDCREHFRAAVRDISARYKNPIMTAIPVQSRQPSDLTIDYSYIPAQQEKKRLVVVLSGIHGVEGYTGSAVQQMVLKEILPGADLAETGVLMIHGVNPYGFKFKQRVSENNIDLNRNCFLKEDGYKTENNGYTQLNGWLNKKRPVRLTEFDQFFFPFYAVQKLIKYSKRTLRQAILQGQYQYENGIYFGGRALEPNIRLIEPVIRQTAAPYDLVLAIDIHTGYGERGRLHLFAMSLDNRKKQDKIETLFKGFQIDWADTRDFYSVNGECLQYLEGILPGKMVLSMPFEFGTLDTQTTLGSLKALHNVIIENQGRIHGYATPEDEQKTRTRFVEGYFPESPVWRSKAIDDARALFSVTLKRFSRMDVE